MEFIISLHSGYFILFFGLDNLGPLEIGTRFNILSFLARKPYKLVSNQNTCNTLTLLSLISSAIRESRELEIEMQREGKFEELIAWSRKISEREINLKIFEGKFFCVIFGLVTEGGTLTGNPFIFSLLIGALVCDERFED